MKVSELIDHLDALRHQYGDLEVRATNDGYAPPEVAIYYRDIGNGSVLLCGKKRPDLVNPMASPDIELINNARQE